MHYPTNVPGGGEGLILSIVAGNAAMLTPADMADALRTVATTLDGLEPTAIFGGPVVDRNGNRCGHYNGSGAGDDE